MSDRTRPPLLLPPRVTPLSLSTPPATMLNRDEMAILSAFREMDGRAKYEALIRMARIARTYPLRAVPRLRLIGGAGNDH